MIQPTTKFRTRGVTLVEMLAVVVVLGGLLTAVGSPFIHALTSYKGQYDSESLQIEGQRAATEFSYFGARASYVTFTSSDYVAFYDSASGYAAFKFIPNGTFTMPDGTVLRKGTFQILLPTVTYTYRGTWLAPSSGGPFALSKAGTSLSIQGYSSGGPVTFKSFVNSSPL